MTALDLVEYLLANCNDVSVENNNIIIDCDEGVLTNDILQKLRQSKRQVLDILWELDSVQTKKVQQSDRTQIGHYEALLTSAQKSLWYSNEINHNKCAYNVVVAYHLKGVVDVFKLEKAFNQLVFLHDVLRTQYVKISDGIKQYVDLNLRKFIYIEDYSNSPSPKADVDARIRHELNRPFDLEKEWAFRTSICKVNDFESYIVLNLDHAIVDGRSARIISADISRLYKQAVDIEALRSERVLHYYDYVSWRESCSKSKMYNNAQEFWLKALEDAPQIHSIPTDRPRVKHQLELGVKYKSVCQGISTNDVSGFAAKKLVGHGAIYQAAFAALIARYSNSSDITFGVVVANRQPIAFNNVVGLFANMVVLRFNLAGKVSLKTLLHDANQLNVNSIKHQFYPFDELVAKINPVRQPYTNPLVQIALVVHEGGGTN